MADTDRQKLTETETGTGLSGQIHLPLIKMHPVHDDDAPRWGPLRGAREEEGKRQNSREKEEEEEDRKRTWTCSASTVSTDCLSGGAIQCQSQCLLHRKHHHTAPRRPDTKDSTICHRQYGMAPFLLPLSAGHSDGQLLIE